MFRNHFDYSGYDRFTDFPDPYRHSVDKKLGNPIGISERSRPSGMCCFWTRSLKLSPRNLSIALDRVKDQPSRQVCLLQFSSHTFNHFSYQIQCEFIGRSLSSGLPLTHRSHVHVEPQVMDMDSLKTFYGGISISAEESTRTQTCLDCCMISRKQA